MLTLVDCSIWKQVKNISYKNENRWHGYNTWINKDIHVMVVKESTRLKSTPFKRSNCHPEENQTQCITTGTKNGHEAQELIEADIMNLEISTN